MTNEQKQLLRSPEKIPALVTGGKIDLKQIPNPHWQKGSCVACHTKTPDKRGLHLRSKDVEQVCNNCHTAVSDHSYIHPSGMQPSANMKKRMNGKFRQALTRKGGKVECTTCHDLIKQCDTRKFRQQGLNPLFFRDGPYRGRSDICYKCHDSSKYERLNPHDQITGQGQLIKESCGLCHRTLEGLTEAKRLEDVDFNITDDLSKMCLGCHPWKPHPGGTFSFGKRHKPVNHLVKMPAFIQSYYAEKQRNSPVLLPLEPGTGKVFCGTCHNPHEKGVIRNLAAAMGADSKQRLRQKDLCVQCHDK